MAERKTFAPVYEETEETIRTRILAHSALADWRKEPGDFIYDAIAPDALEVQRLQINLDTLLRDTHGQYAEGDALDAILADAGLTREAATPNKRQLQITADAGVIIPEGQLLTGVVLDASGRPLQWAADDNVTFAPGFLTATVDVTCTTVGKIGNLATGSQFILSPTIPGVRTITDQGTTIAGTDKETDAAAFKRYDFKINNPDTGGNKNDLKRWAEEVVGVGAARVIPKWAGNLTTKIVVTAEDFTPASSALVEDVQAYMDPGSEGLGNGKAPAGNQVTVVAATALAIDITATVSYVGDSTAAKAAFSASVRDYLATIVFTDLAVSTAKIGALLINTIGVANYTDLQLNGSSTDVTVDTEEVAVLGTVSV